MPLEDLCCEITTTTTVWKVAMLVVFDLLETAHVSAVAFIFVTITVATLSPQVDTSSDSGPKIPNQILVGSSQVTWA